MYTAEVTRLNEYEFIVHASDDTFHLNQKQSKALDDTTNEPSRAMAEQKKLTDKGIEQE